MIPGLFFHNFHRDQENKEFLRDLGIRVEACEGNILTWWIYTRHFDPDAKIVTEMKKRDIKDIIFEIKFPDDYPMSPPFIRLVNPRFKPFTGNITSGGAICMDLLTPQNWIASYRMEPVIVQLKTIITSGNAELDINYTRAYNYEEAKESYLTLAKGHNWL